MDWFAFAKDAIFAALIIGAAFLTGGMLSHQLNRLHSADRMPAMMFRPLKFVVRYGLMLITSLLVLGAFNVDIGNFWNFISAVLGLIAIGFVAVWSLLSNLSSAFLLMTFKPFKIGDKLELPGDGIAGQVTNMNLMFTVIRDDNGHDNHVPNNIFFQKPSRKLR